MRSYDLLNFLAVLGADAVPLTLVQLHVHFALLRLVSQTQQSRGEGPPGASAGESHLKKCIAREGLEGFYRMAPRAKDAVPWRSSRRFSRIWKTRGRETRNGMSCMRFW